MTDATFSPTIDSSMDAEGPNNNYGGAFGIQTLITYIGANKSQLLRAILNFDVSSLIGTYASIDAAQLEYTVPGGASAFNPDPALSTIYRCTRPATWTEAGVTWNKYDGANVWTAGGGDYDAATPAPVACPIASGATSITATGLLAFVTDAIANRANIVSLIHRLDDESKRSGDGPQGFTANSRESAPAPTLRVSYTPLATAGAWQMRGGWP